MKKLNDCSKEEMALLLQDAAKNWLAHDGLWFQAVETECGMDKAIKLDAEAWAKFTVIEAKRIMERHNIKPGGGIPALIQALNFRLYAYINEQDVVEISEHRCVFRMNKCRVRMPGKGRTCLIFPANRWVWWNMPILHKLLTRESKPNALPARRINTRMNTGAPGNLRLNNMITEEDQKIAIDFKLINSKKINS
jgi:hypothetical protein